MPEIKRIFSSGRMNNDLDERLIPNGEYRDALNIRVLSDSNGNSGAVQNINGNTQVGNTGITGATVVGSIADTATDYIYWLIKGDTIDAIARSNGTTIEPVLIDEKTRVGVDPILNFNGDYITGINVLNGFLAFTDNNSEPKIIDIAECVAGSPDFSSHTVINGSPFVEHDITVIKKKPSNAPVLTLIDSAGTSNDKLYELEFVRFAYRWKFKNGQYSAFSPFSEPAFLVGTFNYNPEDAYNLGMVNRLEQVNISGIETTYDNIESIDILLKKSNDQTIYTLETITPAQAANPIEVTTDQVYSVVSSDQILRHWDAVPKKAKAQEISSNRLIYGNYTIGENTSDINIGFNVSIINRTRSFYQRSLKTNRTYQFGVVFEDAYGRQTPVLSNTSGSINIPFGDSSYINGYKAFQVVMDDPNINLSERFSKFKYYVKESSSEYYNVSIDFVFPDPTERDASNTNAIGDVWMALPSAEINKFSEGDFLLLKKEQYETVPYSNPNAKFKVLAVQSEAPSFIGVAPSGYTTGDGLPANTDFDYENYNTNGKFFVRISDPSSLLASMYISGANPTALDIWYYNFITTYTMTGTFLGEEWEVDSGGNKVTRYFYYENGDVKKRVVYGGTGTPYTYGVTISPTFSATTVPTCGTSQPTNTTGWYTTGTVTSDLDGIPKDISARWSSSRLEEVFVCPQAVADFNPAIFETEAGSELLDIYYETEESYPIEQFYDPINFPNGHELRWFNCYNFQNGVESNRIRDDFNAPTMAKQVRVSTVLAEQYKETVNKHGLIWSDLYNSRNGVNKLNQFSAAQPITKDLNPEYGSIQKLHSRDTDLISFCEDKVLRILASKDALYNADGSTNVALSSNVLGQAVPYAGEFGISKNPESFATYGYRAYFTDKARTAVLRLSMDGLELISNRGMQRYFDTELKNNSFILGSYDEEYDEYNVTFQTESISFREVNDGWVSRKSFIPESAVSLNGTYYTFKNGELWKHSDTAYKNTFYYTGVGVPSENDIDNSTITFIYNDEPSTIKNFYTLGYEGDEGWEFRFANTDITVTSTVPEFVEKEGKFFGYLRSTDNAIIDLKQASVKGLGTRS